MNMRQTIEAFATQFAFRPAIQNAEKLGLHDRFVVAGMGGSQTPSRFIRAWKPEKLMVHHWTYGLPEMPEEELRRHLIICSSYSGNTEEPIDTFKEAGKRGLNRAVLAMGGELLRLAKTESVPYVEIPDTGIQPRNSIGFQLIGMFALTGETRGLKEACQLANTLQPKELEPIGRALQGRLKGSVPVIYASDRNAPLAYAWKIRFNETGKIPAFWNVVPELNHNEMNGFDVQEGTRGLSEQLHFILLKDPSDDPRIIQRMSILERLLRDRGLAVESFELKNAGTLEKIFSAILVADWAAYLTGEGYNVDTENVPMVEHFKKLMRGVE